MNPDETAYISIAKVAFLFQIFTDFSRTFGDGYLHKVDSDKILCPEAHQIAKEIVLELENVPTLKATNILETLKEDKNNFVISINLENSIHNIHLNMHKFKSPTKNKLIETVKGKLTEIEIMMIVSLH